MAGPTELSEIGMRDSEILELVVYRFVNAVGVARTAKYSRLLLARIERPVRFDRPETARPPTTRAGTPAGAYSVQLSATAGSTKATAAAQLVVQ